MAIAAPAVAGTRDIANWGNLGKLASGAQIRVVLMNGKSYTGKFESLTDGVIVAELGHGERAFERQNVIRVSTKGKSHRLRNTLIGAAVGAGAGFAFGGLADYEDYFHFDREDQNYTIFAPSFTVVGTIIGAALPTGRWHVLYRSR
ncbi:MAG TPA: hypothetical protein VMI06_15575 [Terriglobia bacterium]|nr:hypothetical protein [Terriglobia bacterium]